MVSSLQCGGTERVATLLANAWAERGWEVRVLSLAEGDTQPYYTLHAGVDHQPQGLTGASTSLRRAVASNLGRISRLRRVISEGRPDAVISFGTENNVLVALAGLLGSWRVLVAERSDPAVHPSSRVWRMLRAVSYRFADRVVVQTRAAAAHFPPSKVSVIANPVLPVGQTGDPTSVLVRPTVLAVGRLVPDKGFDVLIRAFARLAQAHPAWSLAILGEGPERARLESLAAHLGIGERVHLPGVVPDAPEVMGHADVFALSSRMEGMPNALCEAMSAGCALVATRCAAGIEDIVSHEVDGLLVAPEDPEALAAAIERLMVDPALRTRLGEAARRRASGFSIGAVLEAWERALRGPDSVRAVATPGSRADEGTAPSEERDMGPVNAGTDAGEEIERGERFAFGENWSRFLEVLDDRRIAEAEQSLREMLEVDSLEGLRFVDLGSGSGLFSLAARRLGAEVCSVDFDPGSVACTRALKQRYFSDDGQWQVHQGSVLDAGFLEGLGRFDVIYSWGVLHHTGQMWKAMDNAAGLCPDGGRLFVAIYNDQGRASRRWLKVKQIYNRLPGGLRWLVLGPAFLRLWGPTTVRDLLTGRPMATWRSYARERGMTPWRDVVDWVGGLPFEVAKPEEVFEFLKARGFVLKRLRTCAGGIGCNEYVLARQSAP